MKISQRTIIMAGGSQITISDQGITITTNGKVVFKAGLHKFKNGAKVINTLPNLPSSNLEGFNHQWKEE